MLVYQILKLILLVLSMFITETVTNVLRPSESNAGRTLFGGYRITPKQCKATRKLPMMDMRSNGPTICMFNHECSQRQGEVVGACMDGFLFGACCQISSLDEIGNSLLYNAQTAVTNKQQVQQQTKVSMQDELDSKPIKESQLNNYLYKPLSDYQPQTVQDSATQASTAQSQSTFFNVLQNSYAQDFDRGTFSTDLPIRLNSPAVDEFSEASFEYENGNQISQVPLQPIASLQEQLLNPIKPDNFYPASDITSAFSQVTLSDYAHNVTTFQSTTPGYQQQETHQAASENKYVLVQTITNNNLNQKIDNNTQVGPTNEYTSDNNYNIKGNIIQATSELTSAVDHTTVKLNDHSNSKISNVPEKNQLYYDTATPSEHSMMGEAYPVDISLLEEQDASESSTTRPHTPYDSLIMAQNFYTFQKLDKVPEEITVSSQTTHVKGDRFDDKTRPLIQVFSTTQAPSSSTKFSDNTKYEYLISTSTLKSKPLKTSATKTPSSTTQRIQVSPADTLSQHISNDNYIPIELSTDGSEYHKNSVSASTTKTPIAISYVTGPTSPRPSSTSVYDANSKVPPLFNNDNYAELQQLIPSAPSYQTPMFAAAATPITIQGSPSPLYNMHQPPTFVKIQSTMQPTVSTVLITPKPTVSISSTTSKAPLKNNPQQSTTIYSDTIPSSTIASLSSISQIYNQLLTMQPGNNKLNLTSSATKTDSIEEEENDTIILHPAFTQSTTEAFFSVPTDDKPAFPGYFGPTPTYPQFVIPTSEKMASSVEEEMNTSPNDYVNFPPVRNPNLNLSASASDVTTDFELSTPTFVEDVHLKNKMNTLVNKIVESLQDNFDDLSNMIDESNRVTPTLKKNSTTVNTRTTRKPSTTKPKTSTKKPQTQTTKQPTRKTTTSPTRKTTKATRRPTRTTTKRSTTKKPTEDLVDEQDEADVNPAGNPVNDETAKPSGRNIQCGMRPMVKSGRIVGGKGATFGEFPWQVLVRESTWLGLFTKNKCGGVLITNRFVLTAAHCQPGFLASLVAVLGEFDISSNLEGKKPVTKNVKRVIVHRQYNPATFENDLALLEMDSPVQYDVHIVPICMPPDQADFTGRMATVTGWGRLSYDGVVPSILQEVQVPIIENSVCQEMFHTAGHNKKILNSFLCAGYANGQKDSCEGDSGGPLVLQRSDGRYELAGTVSHGIKCAAPYLPGVYIRTTYYKPWLRSITGIK